MPDTQKPKVVLGDGNAFAIIGRCSKAAKRAGWSQKRWDSFRERATAKNYDHLLAVVQQHFDVDLED